MTLPLLRTPYSLTTPGGVIFATSEQSSIISEALHFPDNILVEAVAGAAKTTTIEFVCKYLPVQPILCVAFNKRIADEMGSRLPSHVSCRTMNSLGHRAWGTAIGRRLTLSNSKTYDIVKELIESLPKSSRDEAYSSFSDILNAVRAAKRAGYIPAGAPPVGHSLFTEEDFLSSLEEPPEGLAHGIVNEALRVSIRQSYLGTIDFDDQVYMSVLFGASFPRFPRVIVDETQDLSEINHAMLHKLVTKWLMAVGDDNQSIYAFRGAKSSGMRALAQRYSMKSFPLSVSFRCPQAIVENVRWRVPHMRWTKGGGHVESLNRLGCDSIPDGSAIICRNNAPLFRLALILLGAGRGVQLVGTNLGPSLVKTLKRLGPETLSQEEADAAIDQWARERMAKTKAKAAVADKAECLKVFTKFGSTLGGAIAYCDSLFKHKGAIQLLSGHKAKGLEWDVVFHLDPWRIPSAYAETEEEIVQEDNLRYVISTRAKQDLYTIDLDNITVSDAPSH